MRKVDYFLILFGFCIILTSCKQEKIIFLPDKLPSDYKFTFKNRILL
jgi:hypothetical protein